MSFDAAKNTTNLIQKYCRESARIIEETLGKANRKRLTNNYDHSRRRPLGPPLFGYKHVGGDFPIDEAKDKSISQMSHENGFSRVLLTHSIPMPV